MFWTKQGYWGESTGNRGPFATQAEACAFVMAHMTTRTPWEHVLPEADSLEEAKAAADQETERMDAFHADCAARQPASVADLYYRNHASENAGMAGCRGW